MPKTVQAYDRQLIVCDPADEVTIVAPQNPVNNTQFQVRTRTTDLTPLLIQWNGDGWELGDGDTYFFWPDALLKLIYAANVEGIAGVTPRWMHDGYVPPALPELELGGVTIPSTTLGLTYHIFNYNVVNVNKYMGFAAPSSFYFKIPGTYLMNFSLTFEHDSSNQGRTTNIELLDVTNNRLVGPTYTVGTGRNSEQTNVSFSFLATLDVNDVVNQHEFQFRIGGGDDYLLVAANNGNVVATCHNLTPYVQVPPEQAFVFTARTTGAAETFTIPCFNEGTFNATIDWGDGTPVSTITAYNDADLAHTFADAGDHIIKISGTFPNIFFNNGGDRLKVISVSNLGKVGWVRGTGAFFGCTNMTSFIAGNTDTSAMTKVDIMLRGCSALTTCDVSTMDTSSATLMNGMFRDCTSITDVIGLDELDITGLASTGALNSFATGVTLPTARYDATLIAWAAQTVFNGMAPDFGFSKYTPGGAAEAARTSLINDDGWTITDGGSTLWTPAELTTTAWWKEPAGNVSDPVATWPDNSGNGYDATAATSSPVIASFNGRNAIEFNGTSDVLNIAVPQATEMHVFAAVDLTNMQASLTRIFLGRVNASAPAIYVSTTVAYRPGLFWGAYMANQTADYNSPVILEASFVSGASALTRMNDDDATLSSSVTAAVIADNWSSITGAPGNQWAAMTLGELIIIDGPLTVADRNRIAGYLAYRWGLTANLPVGHPYKTNPPTSP